MKPAVLSLLLFIGVVALSKAQDFHMPEASPQITVEQNFSTSYIKLEYSRPAVKDRTIFGDLIPYGEVWRTGANAVTKITFGEDVEFAGHSVAEGTYALYTIPGEEEWKVILNKGVDNWGAGGFDEKENVLEVSVPAQQVERAQESFSMSLEDLTKNSGNLLIAWSDIAVEVPIKTDNDERIMAHLDKALKSEDPPYAQAASYYLATDRKLEEGLEYTQKAIKQNPEAYYLYWTEAQFYEKLDEHDKALQSAKKAVEIVKEGDPAFIHEYERNYQKLKGKQN